MEAVVSAFSAVTLSSGLTFSNQRAVVPSKLQVSKGFEGPTAHLQRQSWNRFWSSESIVAYASIATATAACVRVARRSSRESRFCNQARLAGQHSRSSSMVLSLKKRHDQQCALVVRHAEAELMGGFVSACSANDRWEDAIDEVVEAAGSGGFDAGFAFISDGHVTMGEGIANVLGALREKLGVRILIGCACSGAIGQPAGPAAEAFDSSNSSRAPIEVERGAVLSVGLLRDAAATPFFLGNSGDGDLQLVDKKAADNDVRSILMMADPFAQSESILKTLDAKFPNAVKAGGLSVALQVGSAERQAYTPSLAIACEGVEVRIVSQGVAGLMLSNIDVHTVVCQGCTAVGPAVKISSARGQVCDGIGGRPANEAVKLIFSSVDPPTRAKMQKFLTVGLGKVGENERLLGNGDWLVRMISGVTPEGGLMIGDEVAAGQPLRFHVRDRESAENDLSMMLKRYRLERSFAGASGDPMGCFLFTCNGRGEGLYKRPHVDARAVRELLGEVDGSRVAGFFCNGEIGSPGLSISRVAPDAGAPLRESALHGFTAVFAFLLPVAAAGPK